MALRPDRVLEMTDGTNILNSTGSKGAVLSYTTVSASGVANGDSGGFVQVASNPSGLRVAGVLLVDFVDIDETRFHVNFNKEEKNSGDHADMVTRGYVVTDKVIGTPSAHAKAYLSSSGCVTPTLHTTGGLVATPLVGEFGGILDEHGFVKLLINLPNGN
jgi:hypothetical protein